MSRTSESCVIFGFKSKSTKIDSYDLEKFGLCVECDNKNNMFVGFTLATAGILDNKTYDLLEPISDTKMRYYVYILDSYVKSIGIKKPTYRTYLLHSFD
jgi:hypothetical protein